MSLLSTAQLNLAVATKKQHECSTNGYFREMIGLSLQSTHWGYLGDWDNYVSGTINKCIINYSLVMKILVVFWPWNRAEKTLVDVQSVRKR